MKTPGTSFKKLGKMLNEFQPSPVVQGVFVMVKLL
jgi:hypothetical protein